MARCASTSHHHAPRSRRVRNGGNAKLELVAPTVLVCLGAVAAKAVLGPSVKITEARGQVQHHRDLAVVPTLHPAALLRSGERREQLRRELVSDLSLAASLLTR